MKQTSFGPGRSGAVCKAFNGLFLKDSQLVPIGGWVALIEVGFAFAFAGQVLLQVAGPFDVTI